MITLPVCLMPDRAASRLKFTGTVMQCAKQNTFFYIRTFFICQADLVLIYREFFAKSVISQKSHVLLCRFLLYNKIYKTTLQKWLVIGRPLRPDIVRFHLACLGSEIFLRELTLSSTLSSNPKSSHSVDPQFSHKLLFYLH